VRLVLEKARRRDCFMSAELPQVSTGDMFRALKEAQTPLANEVRTLRKQGNSFLMILRFGLCVSEPHGQTAGKVTFWTASPARRPKRKCGPTSAEQGKKIQAI